MNRQRLSGLTLKMLGLFSVIIILMALVMLFSVNLITSRQYRKFIEDGDVQVARDYGLLLSRYYELNGEKWDDVDTFLHSIWRSSRDMMENMMSRDTDHTSMMRPFGSSYTDSDRLVLLDTTGLIIADTEDLKKGEIHPSDHWTKGIQITIRGTHVGTVLYGSMIEPVLNPMDRDFLNSVNWTISLSMAITVLLALIAGFYFVSSLISPLKKLTTAINQISEGHLDVQVPVGNKDEISQLAENFNTMSQKLSDAKKWRTRLSADIAHEIRTPITTIQGELEAVIDGLYPMEKSVLKNIYNDTVVLSGIVEDLQLLDSLEVNSQILNLETCDIKDIIDEVTRSFKSVANESGLIIEINADESLPMLNLDRRRIRQVLNNLVSNAIRHSGQKGVVRISAEKEEDRSVRISVSDEGRGMDLEHLERIFDRFYRADESRSRQSGGTGLGLSICKTIVEAHGGTIRAKSEPDKGTEIIFILS